MAHFLKKHHTKVVWYEGKKSLSLFYAQLNSSSSVHRIEAGIYRICIDIYKGSEAPLVVNTMYLLTKCLQTLHHDLS